jgi:hypothetical protein
MITVAGKHIPLFPVSKLHRMRLALVLLLALGAPFGALAQSISEPLRGAEIVSDAARVGEKREGSARFFDPEDGQFDLSYFLENPRGFLPIPIVVTEPAIGYGGGESRHVPPAAQGSGR